MADQRTVQNDERKLKILITLLYYFPHRTGLSIHVQRIAEELARRGHEVTVLTSRYSKSLPRDMETHNGVRIVRLWSPIHISRGMLMPAYPWALYLFMRQFDIVSIHTPMLETALVSVISSLTGCNVVATHHGDLVLPEGRFNSFIRNTMFAFFKYMAKRASAIIAYSQDYANHSYYLQPFLDKVTCIYPPCIMPEPQPEKVAELRASWQADGGPIIGYPGRFVQEKRPDLLIQSLAIINERYPNARIVFAGEYDIPYENTWQMHHKLVEQYQDQLIFLGLLEDMQDMANFMAACDVLCHPSDTECFALVQVEGMLCGTPFVMSDTPGGRVPIQLTGMGELSELGNYRSVAEAILKILDDPNKYQRPREEIEEIFSFKDTVDQYEELLQKYARNNHD